MDQCPCHERKNATGVNPFFERQLAGDCPERGYKTKLGYNPCHWGQMKLLLSEIEFLTPYYGKPNLIVIYAGAAPGVHMPILADLFPLMHFVLVDPAPSMLSHVETPRVTVRQEFMTDVLAREFRDTHGDRILFISDVRVGLPKGVEESDRDQQIRIQGDMDAQMGWLRIMDPISSILKFRLPWNLSTTTVYPSGRVYFPVYGKYNTHETRLVVDRHAEDEEYNNRRYERSMSFFNQVLRPALYPTESLVMKRYNLTRNTGTKHLCHDCTSFETIISDYLRTKIKKRLSYSRIKTECTYIETSLNYYALQWNTIKQGL